MTQTKNSASKKVKIRGYEFVEKEISAGKPDKIKIGDIEVLRGVRVKRIVTYRVGNVSKTPEGNTVASDTAFKGAFLLLKIAGKDRINSKPLSEFDPTLNNGQYFEFKEPVFVDWTNSAIINGDAANQTPGEYYLIGVEYETEVDEKDTLVSVSQK